MKKSLKRKILLSWRLYVLLAPSLILLIVFNYIPMYGVLIAFQNYNPSQGFLGSNWIGFVHFKRFLDNYYFWELLKNTLRISLMSIIINTPLPIIFALMVNEISNKHFKRSVQTISYAPYFISMVVVVGMVFTFFNPERGIVNKLIELLGGKSKAFMESPEAFAWIYVLSGTWQGLGWSAIIYISTLSNVDPSLHEAASIDGASRLQRIWHINMPAILPIATILFILAMGNMMSVGFEKAYLLQTPLNLPKSNIIATYVYSVTIKAKYPDWSYGAAVGLFNTAINMLLLIATNIISKRTGGESL